jgi:hypothetical protein
MIRTVIPALKNRQTNVVHLAAGGEPHCGTRVDVRLISFEVRRKEEITCDKCRRSECWRIYDYLREEGSVEAADQAMRTTLKPPRMLPPRDG